MVTVCWFCLFWHYFDLLKRVKFGVSGHFLGSAWREWPEIWYAAASWPPSELIRLWLRSGDFSLMVLFKLSETGKIWGFQVWSCSVDFPHYGDPLAEIGHIWGFWALSGEHVGVKVRGRRRHISHALHRILSSWLINWSFMVFMDILAENLLIYMILLLEEACLWSLSFIILFLQR